MEFSCTKCNTITTADATFEIVHFACPNCKSLYSLYNGFLKWEREFSFSDTTAKLKVGQKGTLKGEEFTVTGWIVKKVYGSYYWREYILLGKSGNFKYLSETDGHWIILDEIEKKHDVSEHPTSVVHDDMYLDLYEYTDGEIVLAAGFFDFTINKKKFRMTEYINPPFILSFETINEEESVFFGKHISKAEVSKAFAVTHLPYQAGIGIVQPKYFDVEKAAIIFCVVAILMFLSHWIIYKDRAEEHVLSENIPFNNTEFVSKSFELKGGSAPLTVTVHSGVDNSWANIQVALVNEGTSDEVYASKDVEYYHGYTDGENWTEGDTSEKFNICGVSEGKYHLAITPQKPPEDIQNSGVQVTAVWDEPSTWNVWLPIVFMGVIGVGGFLLDRHQETQRWADSNYSPYSE